MCRTLLTLGLCCCTGFVSGVALLRGEEPADAQAETLANESRSRAEAIGVSVAAGGVTTEAAVHPTPLMKYTDPARQIGMATLWVWEDEGSPVALGKVEAYQRPGGPQWVYCFTSTTTGLVEGKWPDEHHFRARKPGITWTTLDGPVPHDTAAGRLRQMKELFRRFTARETDDLLETSGGLRPLARPLHEFSSRKHGVLQGILCGLTANGTNPDVIVALEVVRPAEGKDAPPSWRYGVVGMTAAGVTVKLDKEEVFTKPYTKSPGDFDTWTWFLEGAPKK